ncbi:MAG TPA: serine/threonine-protein kinase [Pirellulales bacterium]|nr:serine/threonine-protein kinase [Pirellulales bacterium]
MDTRPPLISPDLVHLPQFDYREFVLESHLGSGGIGKVYRAWWKSRQKHVAVKMLRKHWWRQPGVDELFFREAAILVKLRHPNIVSVHGIGRTSQGGCFLVIDLMDGGDLSSLDGTALPAQALEWAAQAADGLAYAHQQGVVHRDVKPSNLLLDRSGRVKVADFGLALLTTISGRGDDGLIGTAAYMAPEQLFGEGRQVGKGADIFSLGAALYTLLTGQPPYEGGSFIDVVERRLNGAQPVSLRSLCPDVPESLENALARCLVRDPNKRFATAEELAAALRRAAGDA